ncbi:MAG: CopG family transcriptional regulator [Christensenellaceae bacterium]|jgi:putative iron-only hydrogenase system regulator|nr:CopG family transcriptional regulator [Christensenellaceae bacterium]
MKRVGIIGIVVKDNKSAALEIQSILTEMSDIIIGRMGIPDRIHNINVLSIAVEGETEQISALSGKLGRLNGVSVKSVVTSIEI